MSVLADADVAEIRERRAAGERAADLSDEFGLSLRYVSALISGQRRPGAPGPIGRYPASSARSPRRRFSVDVLDVPIRRIGVVAVAAGIGVSSRTLHRWRHAGIPAARADQVADYLGSHPAAIWADYYGADR